MNEKEILVSIIVPVYNTKKYLEKCLDSLVQQDYHNLEIILVDDGSKDGCGSICDEYAEKDKRIKVIHKKNEGVVKARIDAYNISSGDFITFVDSDDYIRLDTISLMVGLAQEYQAELIVCQYTDVYGEKYIPNKRSIKGLYSKDEIKELLNSNLLYDPNCYGSGIPLHLCEKLIKRNLLQDVLNKAEGQWFGEDLISSLHIIDKVNRMYVSDEHIYFYIHHPEEVINRNPLEKWPAYELVWKRILEFDKNNYFKNQLPYRIWAFTKYTYNYVLSIDNYKNYKAGLKTISKSIYLNRFIFNNQHFLLKSKGDKLIYTVLKYKLFTIYYLYRKIKHL